MLRIDLGAWGKGRSGQSSEAIIVILVRYGAGLDQGSDSRVAECNRDSGSRGGMRGTFHLEHGSSTVIGGKVEYMG